MNTRIRNLALTVGIIAASIGVVFGVHVARVALSAYTVTPPKSGTVSGNPLHHGFTPVTTTAMRHTVTSHRAVTRL